MVYTSIPAYTDPANWQQQQPNHQQGNTGASASSQLLHPPPPLPPSIQPHGAGNNISSIRPGSMADRARMGNIPMQEPAQRCPRCDSTNTKFCYFNNYSLSQPRHFCKTCRRYWTRGGALRNVPVGGGCRRNNKRSKGTSSSSSSKSPATSSDRQPASAGGGPTNSASSSGGASAAADMVGLGGPMVPPSLRFMAPLHHQLGDHFSDSGREIGLNYGLSYSAISGPMGGISDLSSAGLEQWRVPQTHQFPFLEASSSPHGLFPFESSTNEAPGYGSGGVGFRPKVSASGVLAQLAPVKMEENNNNNNNQELNLSWQFLGMSSNSTSDQAYWSTGTTTSAWTDLTGFSSSSTTTNPQ